MNPNSQPVDPHRGLDLAKILKFFLTEFWLKSYFFLDFCGVFGETARAVHLMLTIK